MSFEYSVDDSGWGKCARCGGPRLIKDDSKNCALCDLQDSIDKEEAKKFRNKTEEPTCATCGNQMWILDPDLVGYKDYLDCWCNTCKKIVKGKDEKSKERDDES